MAMNASAVVIFAFSSQIDWPCALALAMGGVAGAFVGTWLMSRLPENILRGFVALAGVALSVWLFVR